jgi:hypothetical protein
MQLKINNSTLLFTLAALSFQQSAVAAIVNYTVTGSFYGDSLEVSQYDNQTGDEIPVNAFIHPQTNIISSSFTLNFRVDEDTVGTTPIFNPVRNFWDAVSNVSLNIDGSNVLTSTETGLLQQFPGENGYASRWSWSLFSEGINLNDVMVFDNGNPSQPLTTLHAESINFALYDSTDTVYSSGYPFDIFTASLGDFNSTEFSVWWGMNFDEEPSGGFDGNASYAVYGTIDSISSVSEVPLPAAAWLFISAIGGLVVSRRKQLRT